MKFILIVMLLGADAPAVIEFDTLAACEHARKVIAPMTNSDYANRKFSACVPKA